MLEDPSLAPAPKLLDQAGGKIRLKHCSLRIEQTYVVWIKRYILFHGKPHPVDMGAGEIEAFLGLILGRESPCRPITGRWCGEKWLSPDY